MLPKQRHASKLILVSSSLKEEAHPFKFLLDPKFVTIAMVAPIIRLLLKPAREEPTARFLLRIDA